MRSLGMPVGGAFDIYSFEVANALVGNAGGEATLELTLQGGVFQAEMDLAIGFAGGCEELIIQGQSHARRLPLPGSTTLRRGERLAFGPFLAGCRAYLAVAGGWAVPMVLGSCSSEAALKAGDRISAPFRSSIPTRRATLPVACRLSATTRLRVLTGPDWQPSPLEEGDSFSRFLYRVTHQCSRVGLRLDGPRLEQVWDPSRLSAPVLPGAVQIAGGLPIILGVACGTMGGYPQIAQVIWADIPVLGQLRPGDQVSFQWITIDEARAIESQHRQRCSQIALLLATQARDGFVMG